MSPPAVIKLIVRPVMLVEKFKKCVIRTVLGHIGSRFVSFLILIDSFPVQPFVERTTVIEYTVQDNLHSTLMDLLYQLDEQLIAEIGRASCRERAYIL